MHYITQRTESVQLTAASYHYHVCLVYHNPQSIGNDEMFCVTVSSCVMCLTCAFCPMDVVDGL